VTGPNFAAGAGRLPRFTDAELAKVPAFIKTKKDGSRQLILTPGGLRRMFPDIGRFWADPNVTRMLVRDAKRKAIKRDVRRNKRGDRTYCFELRPSPDNS